MQGIEFDDDINPSGLLVNALQSSTVKKSFMLKLLEKAGAKNKATANMILLGIAIVFFSITIYLYAGILRSGTPSKLSPEETQAQARMLRETIPPR